MEFEIGYDVFTIWVDFEMFLIDFVICSSKNNIVLQSQSGRIIFYLDALV